MAHRNQHGQILIESVFLLLMVFVVLIVFQMLVDHEKNQINTHRISKIRKDLSNVQKNETEPAK